MTRRRSTGLWRHPDFLKLWAGQTVSAVGEQVTLLAVPLLAALTLDASPFQMGLLGTAGTAPNLLVGLPAGVWVDRVRRRPLLIGADIGRALLLLSIPMAWTFDLLSIWQLYAVVFLTGVFTTIFDVADGSYLPSLVERSQLVSANGKLEASRSVANTVGPGLAGGLIQTFTAPIAILVDAMSFGVSAVLIHGIRAKEPDHVPRGPRGDAWNEMFVGLRTLHRDPLLRPIAAASLTFRFFHGVLGAVFVLYATQDLRVDPATLGVIFGAGGVGSLLGAVLAAHAGRVLGIGPTIMVASVGGGLATLLLSSAGDNVLSAVPILMTGQFVYWFMGTTFGVNATSLRQAITPDRLLGRVNGGYSFLTLGSVPVGFLLGGVLGELIDLRATVIVSGIGMLVSILWLVLSPVRALRTIDAQARDGRDRC